MTFVAVPVTSLRPMQDTMFVTEVPRNNPQEKHAFTNLAHNNTPKHRTSLGALRMSFYIKCLENGVECYCHVHMKPDFVTNISTCSKWLTFAANIKGKFHSNNAQKQNVYIHSSIYLRICRLCATSLKWGSHCGSCSMQNDKTCTQQQRIAYNLQMYYHPKAKCLNEPQFSLPAHEFG